MGLFFKKQMVKNLLLFLIGALILCSFLLGVGNEKINGNAEGDVPSDSRARIGFERTSFYMNEYYLEENNGNITVRIYVSSVQNVDIPFTLSETRFGEGGSQFVFESGYVLPAGNDYVNITFNQIAGAESGSGVRLSDIYLHCDTPTVTVSDIEYYGEDEPFDDDFLAVVYDRTGDTELIIEGLPYIAYEEDKKISTRLISSGSSLTEEGQIYYRIKDYNPANTKELVFENYYSVLVLDETRENSLEIIYFDNSRLNLREAYELEITHSEGIARIFDVSRRRYILEDEECILNFAVMDDEPLSDKYVARAQYYQPGETNPTFQISEGSVFTQNVFFDGLNGNNLPSFRLYYSIDELSTAVYGVDYVLGVDYSQVNNLGYIEVPGNGLDFFHGTIDISTIDDRIFNGTRTVIIKFFVNSRNDILLQPLDTTCLNITDNEFLPENNTVGWSSIGSLNGCGFYEDGVLTINQSFYDFSSFLIGTETDYMGTAPLNIPVRFEDVTAKNGVDYLQENVYNLLAFRPQEGMNKYGIELNLQNDFYFTGTRRFKVTIIEEGLTDGLTLNGNAELIIDLVGRVEEGYNYIDYSQSQTEKIFSVGKNETLSFTLNRVEKEAKSTYIDITRNVTGAFYEGIHIETGLFPYEVEWAENETKKIISFDFLQGWNDTNSASGLLTCLNGNKQEFNNTYGAGHKTSVPVTLYLSNSIANYYFPGSSYLSLLKYEYLYSSSSALQIEVRRDLLSATYANTSVDYHLTFDYFKPEQIILSGSAASIGTHIDDLSGTLEFLWGETTRYITVTLPNTVSMGYGSKFVNIVLSNPSDNTYLLYDRDYEGKFSLAQIKITNDVTPVLEYGDLTTVSTEEEGYVTTVIDPFAYQGKEYDSFRVGLTPYLPDETPYLTKLNYPIDFLLYSVYDLSTVGVEVYENGRKINATSIDPYIYDYIDGTGSHQTTYGYQYVIPVPLNKGNPYATFTLKYAGIAYSGLSFLATSLLIKAENEFFMDGWENYEKRLILNGCEEGASVQLEIDATSLVSLGETDVKAGDIVYMTVSRSSEDPAASSMFFESEEYGVKSVFSSWYSVYYFEPLQTWFVFEPYVFQKTIPFITRDQRPVGEPWNQEDATASIILYDYFNPELVFQELVVNVHEEWDSIINAEVNILTNSVYVHKYGGAPYDPIRIKFTFDRPYDIDIEFSLSGLDARIGNLAVLLPAGETEVEHSFTINEGEFIESSEILSLDFSWELETVISNTELELTFPREGKVVVISQSIGSKRFHLGEPEALSIDEDFKGYLALDVVANRSIYPAEWKDITAHVTLGGTAEYGQDYIIKYSEKGSENVFEIWPGTVVIGKKFEKSTIKIYPIDNRVYEGSKTIEITILDYFQGHPAYPETITFTINDNEYFGDIKMTKSEHGYFAGWLNINIERENFTESDFELSYEIVEIIGEYGVDYTLQTNVSLPRTGTINFYGSGSQFGISVSPLNEKGESASFFFRIIGEGSRFSIINNEIIVSFCDINEGGEYKTTITGDNVELYEWPSNFGEFLLDYTKYYSKYTSGQKVMIASKDFGSGSKEIYLDFDPLGLTYVSVAGFSGEYKVPSGIRLDKWKDINDDGREELIFIANIDTCFGGAAELSSLGLYGIFALDLTNGEYTQILDLENFDPSLHADLFFGDLKGDGFPEAVVFLTPWAENYLRRKGGNSLLIVSNDSGEFSVESVYDSNARINGNYLTLYSVRIFERYKGCDRNYLEVSYMSRYDWSYGPFGTVFDVSAGKNSDFIYFTTGSLVAEGSTAGITVFNVSGAAGDLTIFFDSNSSAVYGRDYVPNRIDLSFAEGEYQKNVNVVTLHNNIPINNVSVNYWMESSDFNVGNQIGGSIVILQNNVLNKEIGYTIHDGFDSSHTNPGRVTGDSVKFSLHPLTIDGIRCFDESNELYDARFSVSFGDTVWQDEDGDGYISITGLESRFLEAPANWFLVNVEFLKEGTDSVIGRREFRISYMYYDESERYSFVTNSVDINQVMYKGKLRIEASSIINISVYDHIIPSKFKLSITTDIDDKTYNFYSNNQGYISAGIDFGNVNGIFHYSYVLTNLSVSTPQEESGDVEINAYLDTMDFPITVIDSVRQSLLRGVLIEVEGINTDYRYSGRSNQETGLFILPALTPLKQYSITVNGDYIVPYFEVFNGTFTPTVYQTNLSIMMELRTENMSLDKVSVVSVPRQDLTQSLKYSNTRPGGFNYAVWDYDKIVRYIANSNETLNSEEMRLLNQYLLRIHTVSFYGQYRISGDVLFSSDYPGVYKALNKRDPSDITFVSYRYNPDYDFGTVKVLVGRQELTSQNSRYLARSLTYDYYQNGNFQTDMVHFYSFPGNENCIIDLEIDSDAYLNGKKMIPLVAFGTGLGSFLLNPVEEIFSSLETASVPANFAFLNGMSFILGFADIDFGFDYDEENMTFSIYMGASKGLYEASRGMDYGDVGRPTLAQLRAAKAAGLSMGRGQAGLGVGIGGKMKFVYVDGDWKLLAGEIYFSVEASYNYTKYILLPVVSIPAFFSATVSLSVGTTIYFDWNAAEEYTEITGDLAIELAVEIECGIGIRGFLSASVYGRAGIEVIIQLESGATKLTLYVEGGVRIQIIFWKYEYSFGRAEWSTQSDGYVDRDQVLQSLNLSALSNSTDYSGVAALYTVEGTLFMGMTLNEAGEPQEVVLVSNVYEKSSPKIAELPDGSKMIAWINYDTERGEDNAEVVNYIYFDGENWNDVGVLDETLTADIDMDLRVLNDRFAIVCTEVKEELATGATISERLLKSDVAFFVFDPSTNGFSKTVLTDNLFNDRQVLFDYENGNGIAVVYRSENENITDDMTINDFLCGEDADNKLYFSIYDESTDSWGSFSLFNFELKAVSTMSLKIVGGIAYIALECDNDDNFDSTWDREIVLIQYVFATGNSRIQYITDNDVQDIAPSLTRFKGKIFMSYRSGNEVRYWFENNSYFLATLPDTHTNFDVFSSDEYAIMLFTLSVEGVSQVFASVMDEDSMVFSSPSQVTISSKPTRDPVLSFSEEGITVYYCADTYTLISSEGEEYTFSIDSDIMAKQLTLFSDLSTEVLEPDYSEMTPEEEYEFTLRIYNNGNLNVVNPWVKVYLGDSIVGESVAGIILGNNYYDLLCPIVLPNERAQLRFEVGKLGLVESSEDNTDVVDILLTDLSFEEDYSITWNENGTLSVKLNVVNNGKIDVENISVSVTSYSDISSVYSSTVLSILSEGEIREVVFDIPSEYVTYNSNNELWIKAYVLTPDKDIYSVSDDDFKSLNNTKSLRTARVLFAGGSSLAILHETMNLTVGNNGYVNLVYTGDGEISITSSDPSILLVDGRNLIPLKAGTVTITITDGNETKTLVITVSLEDGSEEPIIPVVGAENKGLKWWGYLSISIASLIFSTFIAYLVLFLIWKKKGVNKIKFLDRSFRQINKVFFKTELNDKEKEVISNTNNEE
ncbi:MAG: Calx-beta domain protein [Firmicutes bacterium ADurb.Bin080]|nr:MAG: Calx-beta domain protein [Firmicutes bacterium ADurb.Bin080]